MSIPALKFMMAVDPEHRCSNEAERANRDIYDDFELKRTFGFQGSYQFFFLYCKV